MLGRRLLEAFSEGGRVLAYPRRDLDVTRLDRVRDVIHGERPDWILHAAAFTRVDEAEREREEAFRVNALGTRNVALAASEVNGWLVYFSTDYIFDGTLTRSIQEWDPPSPINQYGASKLAGEWMVRNHLQRHLIIRTSWLFGPDGPNFVEKIAARARAGNSLRVVDDQRGSPSFTRDLARMTRQLVQRRLVGTYHVTNSGHCSWFELAQEIVKVLGLEVDVVPVSTEEFPSPATRPRNSILDNSMLRLEGLGPLPHWRDAVRSYLGVANG